MAVKVVDKKFAVDVRGLVKKPGQFLMKSSASLDEIIAEAGGLQEASPQNPMARYARIKQGAGSTLVNISDYYAGGEVVNPKWQGGEIVFFQTEAGVPMNAAGNENYLQMLGEVKVAGQYQYRENADLLDYIVRAGGPNDRADLDNIQIIREEAGQKISMVAEIESVEDRNQIPRLKGGDIVIVHAQNPTSFDKKTRRVSEVAQVFTGIATVILLFITL
jgi:protein involved in polysaccharide export with SLBB domain